MRERERERERDRVKDKHIKWKERNIDKTKRKSEKTCLSILKCKKGFRGRYRAKCSLQMREFEGAQSVLMFIDHVLIQFGC